MSKLDEIRKGRAVIKQSFPDEQSDIDFLLGLVTEMRQALKNHMVPGNTTCGACNEARALLARLEE